ncbi:hypothetical protein MMC25_002776 [Agyrium rufum]|nr:hypothetical protein [Agyrium rufum]
MATEADYIIIGGGTAGLVVATRLSENPGVEVLVIEAGEDQLQNPAISIPALWPSLLGSQLDWSFRSVPAAELNDRQLGYPQGRLLGGSSGLNTHAFVPPSRNGLTAWADLGNPGWDWKTLAPYYKKTYTLTIPTKEVIEHLGLSYLKASNDGDSHASDYYAPAKSRDNLHVITGYQVEKILFEQGIEAVATGVSVIKAGKSEIYRARKEAILAAGALNSPKILELSGIGNPEVLRAHGINVIVDNPHVGENFQDHPQTGMSFEVKDGIETLDDLNRKEPAAIQKAMQDYQEKKTGPFSTAAVNYSAVLPVMDFYNDPHGQEQQAKNLSKNLTPGTTSRSIYLPQVATELAQKIYSSETLGSMHYIVYGAQGNFGADSSEARNVAMPAFPGKYVTIAGFLSYPLSRGSVHIASSNPLDMPLINPAFLSHPLDLEMLARHVRFIHSIAKAEPFAKILKKDGHIVPEFADFGTDLEKAKDYLRRTVMSAWHPCGTCANAPSCSGWRARSTPQGLRNEERSGR